MKSGHPVPQREILPFVKGLTEVQEARDLPQDWKGVGEETDLEEGGSGTNHPLPTP